MLECVGLLGTVGTLKVSCPMVLEGILNFQLQAFHFNQTYHWIWSTFRTLTSQSVLVEWLLGITRTCWPLGSHSPQREGVLKFNGSAWNIFLQFKEFLQSFKNLLPNLNLLYCLNPRWHSQVHYFKFPTQKFQLNFRRYIQVQRMLSAYLILKINEK